MSPSLGLWPPLFLLHLLFDPGGQKGKNVCDILLGMSTLHHLTLIELDWILYCPNLHMGWFEYPSEGLGHSIIKSPPLFVIVQEWWGSGNIVILALI